MYTIADGRCIIDLAQTTYPSHVWDSDLLAAGELIQQECIDGDVPPCTYHSNSSYKDLFSHSRFENETLRITNALHLLRRTPLPNHWSLSNHTDWYITTGDGLAPDMGRSTYEKSSTRSNAKINADQRIGDEKDFQLAVKAYIPPSITCYDTPPAAQGPAHARCSRILDRMHAWEAKTTFGAARAGEVESRLPYRFSDRKHSS